MKKQRNCAKCLGQGRIFTRVNCVDTPIPCNLCSGTGKVAPLPPKPQEPMIGKEQRANGTSLMFLLFAIWMFILVFLAMFNGINANMQAIRAFLNF